MDSNNYSLKNKYHTDQLEKDLKELHLILNERQTEQFMKYYELLIEWNSFMNLTAITDFDEVMKKHFVDSISLVKAFDLNRFQDYGRNIGREENACLDSCRLSVIDIGTGAGFPGIPLKIVFPDIKITLLDSLQKRIKFLDEVIDRLDLKYIDTVHGRAEDYARPDKLREKYDLCVSRAVSTLSTLSEYCLPFVKTGGKFISYKSEKLAEEITEAEKAVSILGGKIEKQVDFLLPSSEVYRNLLVIGKVKPTPKKYPRKAGLPAKEPIKTSQCN